MMMITYFVLSWIVALLCSIWWMRLLAKTGQNLQWSDLSIWDKLAGLGCLNFLAICAITVARLLLR